MEELDLEYELVSYDRDPDLSAPKVYKALSPTGTAPVIEDGDLVLSESSAIIDYVMDRHGGTRLRPSVDDPLYPRYLFWFHAIQGSMMAMLTMKYVLNRFVVVMPFFVAPLFRLSFQKLNQLFMGKRLTLFLELMERDLDHGPWLAGQKISAADILMAYNLGSLPEWAGLDARYPNCQAYAKRVQELPSYQRAVQKGGPFGAPPARNLLG